MPRYRISGTYALTVTKVVEAADADEAWEQTGIIGDLEDDGWNVDVEGETDWDVDEVQS